MYVTTSEQCDVCVIMGLLLSVKSRRRIVLCVCHARQPVLFCLARCDVGVLSDVVAYADVRHSLSLRVSLSCVRCCIVCPAAHLCLVIMCVIILM